MDSKLASGDCNNAPVNVDKMRDIMVSKDINALKEEDNTTVICDETKRELDNVTEKEMTLKERIEKCRKIIESLKLELTEEKDKLTEESKSTQVYVLNTLPINNSGFFGSNSASYNKFATDRMTPSDNYLCSANVDSKLGCDESLMEYEKQLEKYQNTLNMAQTEKKNAIRKQMLAKAYKLKLLEVENQCNIELLRVKQSLQCLEPLQMIVKQWDNSDNNPTYNLSSFELIPRYPEVKTIAPRDVIFTDDEKSEFVASKDDLYILS